MVARKHDKKERTKTRDVFLKFIFIVYSCGIFILKGTRNRTYRIWR